MNSGRNLIKRSYSLVTKPGSIGEALEEVLQVLEVVGDEDDLPSAIQPKKGLTDVS